MNTNTLTQSLTTPTTSIRPGRGRRTALAVTGFLAGVIPVVFAFNMARFLVTGELSEHRFHQATGQGLLLCALWLVPIAGLVRAGWSGRRPSAAAGWQHLVFVVAGAVCAAVSTGGGAPALLVVIGVPGALLWLALPERPSLRGPVQVDPVLMPLALLVTAWFAPYAVEQLQLQNAATGHHAQNPHFFDMAWTSVVVMVTGLLAATMPAVRHLFGWVAGSAVVIGAAGLAFGEPTGWSVITLALGAMSGAAALARR